MKTYHYWLLHSITNIVLVALLASNSATAETPKAIFTTDIALDLKTVELASGPLSVKTSLLSTQNSNSVAEAPSVGDSKYWMGLDSYHGNYYFKEFQLMASGTFSEIWVATDLSWPDGDSRITPVIDSADIQYLLEEYDTNINPTHNHYFGAPDDHNGTDSLLVAWGYFPSGYYDGNKNVILVDNIRDENYFDPDYPAYIAGFYEDALEGYFDRNVITVDTFDWDNRLGPDVTHPYLYEKIIAHQFHQLIHDDKDSDEEAWVTEGFGFLAQFLCGYGHPEAEVNIFAEHPENSLVLWGDQGDLEISADKGISYLWALYLLEQYNDSFIQTLILDPANGISGVNSALTSLGYINTFSDIYHKFAVALVTDSSKKDGAYALRNIDFVINTDTTEAYDTVGAPPWGTDFIRIEKPKDVEYLSFNGEDATVFDTPWSSVGGYLLSGAGELIDNWLITAIDLTLASSPATLTINHSYDIEDYWDFGFVQVSTDGGHTWTSLEDNEHRTTDAADPNADPNIQANLPGFTGPSVYMTSTFDLSAYSGQVIHLAFRYMTDSATSFSGWSIDDIEVTAGGSQVFYSDGSSTTGFMDLTELLPVNNEFTVALIGTIEKKNGVKHHRVSLPLDGVTEEGSKSNIDKLFKNADYVDMLITFDAPEGWGHYANYDFEVVY